MLHRSTLQLLRFHFSLFLLPVYLFAVSQCPEVNRTKAVAVFFILHFLVYPASNGYNSYMDKDETPIGGLANPLQPTRELFWVTVAMDVISVIAALFINWFFALGILFYIIASRAYSYRNIRLKKYPVIGFLTVFLFQGALIYLIIYASCSEGPVTTKLILPCLIASLLIGALYPLTQIYQHEADKKDGVITISYLLGKKGSFIFSGLLFLSATAAIYFYFSNRDSINHFFKFLLYTLPVVLFFCYWMMKVWHNESAANFKNSLWMNVIATLCTTAYFTMLVFNR